jgi:hypothetical protein
MAVYETLEDVDRLLINSPNAVIPMPGIKVDKVASGYSPAVIPLDVLIRWFLNGGWSRVASSPTE